MEGQLIGTCEPQAQVEVLLAALAYSTRHDASRPVVDAWKL